MDPLNDEEENRKPSASAPQPSTEGEGSLASYNGMKPPLMVRKLLQEGDYVPPLDRDNFVGFRPHHIFLYGTLMDPVQLRKVLQLKNTPTLQPATIVGWKVMLWGQYPTLVFVPGSVIHGMTYKVQEESHMELLEYYETEAYKLKGCNVKMSDGTEIFGETFIYNGDESLLKEGSFDLKDWQMQQLEKEK